MPRFGKQGARDGDGWYVDSVVYDLFKRTRGGEAIHQWRHTHKAISAQLRRWAHACRRLVLETSAFTIPPPKEVAVAARGHKSVAWGRGRAKRICDLAAGWAHGGEAVDEVFPAAPPGIRMAEWIDSQLSSGGDRARGARPAGVQQVSTALYGSSEAHHSASGPLQIRTDAPPNEQVGTALDRTLRDVRGATLAACSDPRQSAAIVNAFGEVARHAAAHTRYALAPIQLIATRHVELIILENMCIFSLCCRFFHMRVGRSMAHILVERICTRVCLIVSRAP
jgi:hypothetical protein